LQIALFHNSFPVLNWSRRKTKEHILLHTASGRHGAAPLLLFTLSTLCFHFQQSSRVNFKMASFYFFPKLFSTTERKPVTVAKVRYLSTAIRKVFFCISYILGNVSFLLTSLRTKRNKVCYSSSRKKVKKVYSCSLPFDRNTYPRFTPSAEPEKKFKQLTLLRSSYLNPTMERNLLNSPSSPFMHLNKEKNICCKSHIPPLFQFPFE